LEFAEAVQKATPVVAVTELVEVSLSKRPLRTRYLSLRQAQ